MEFKIGDRVIGKEGRVEGKKGIIVDVMNDCLPYGVKFDERLIFGHDLDTSDRGARCENGFGYWCQESDLELLGLEVGTRIESIVGIGNERVVGAKGTIIGNDGRVYAIKFDENVGGHNFNNYDELDCEVGYGWWCLDYKFKVIEEEEEEEELKVGDRVVTIANGDVVPKGKKGTIVSTIDGFKYKYGVEFDENICGHDLSIGGVTCKHGHGWWFMPIELELLDNSEENGQATIRLIDNDTEEVILETETTISDIGVDLHKKEFKVGDRVVGVDDSGLFGDIVGVSGTIVAISGGSYGVVFDDHVGGHSLRSSGVPCERGYGLWCDKDRIELLVEDTQEESIKTDASESIKDLLKAGHVVEISCYEGKRIGVVTVLNQIKTAYGYHELSDYDDELLDVDDILDNDQSIDKIYENTNEGLKLIWNRDDYWSNVKVDTEVQVRDSESSAWQNRYFAKVDNGRFYTFSGGGTSFSRKDTEITGWNFARLYKEEV